MKKVIVATLVAALGASAWADFTKVQESFEDITEGQAWTYSADGYWSSTDTAASDNITTVAYAEDEDYAYDTAEGAENTPAVDGWSGDKYLNLAKATNLSRNFQEGGTALEVSTDGGYVLDTLVSFTATEAEDAPKPSESDKFLIWLQETELENGDNGDITCNTNLVIKCGNDDTSATSELTLLTSSSGALPVNAGEWARVSVKAIPLYENGPLGFVVYINGAAVKAGDPDETYQALFTKSESLTDAAKGYYALNQIFPSLTSSTSLTAVDFKGTGKIDDFQLVAASDEDAPAFTADPIIVTAQSVGLDSEESKSLQMTKGTTIPTEEIANSYMLNKVDGYAFVGWYTDAECETKVEFPYTIEKSVTFYAKFNVVVAKIGDTNYPTFQEAVSAAITAATADNPVQIDIARDFTIDSTITLLGTGKDTTKIIINNEKYTVTFNTKDKAGFTIDDAAVTFEGEGTWKNPFETIDGTIYAKTMFCIGEVGKTVDGTKMLAPADVIINSGTYISHDSHVFNVACGSATVNGGVFKVENYSKKFCFRAEKSSIDEENATATLIITGGTFEIPDKSAGLPVGHKDEENKYATTKILATGSAKFKCNKKCIAGGLSDYDKLGSYLVVENEKGEYGTTSDYAFTLDSEGYYYAAPKVVAIGEVGYASLQDAIDEAIAASTAETLDPVPITITRDITIDQMVKIIGNGTNETKIAINNDKAVTFDFKAGEEGLQIANASVVLVGSGSWKRTNTNNKQMISIGEVKVDDDAIAPGNLVVKGGSFLAEANAHIISMMTGVVVVEGGTFETKGISDKFCIRAEADASMNGATTNATICYVAVKGGTFITPANDTVAPVGVKKGTGANYTPAVFILELDTDDNPNAALKFQGNETQICEVMGDFLGVIDADGEPEYDDDNTYKFKLDTEDGFCKVVKTVWGTAEVEWTEGKVVSFDYYEGEDVTNIVIGTHSSYSESYDIDDKTEVKVAKDSIKFATGWVLDEDKSTLGPVTMTEDRTLYIAAKLKYNAVDPESSSTTYTDKTEADDLADAINSNKVDMITAPDIGAAIFSKPDYVKLFEAKVNGNATSGYTVSVVLTDAAKTTIQKQVDEVFAAESLDLSAVATDGASFVATATPGLYYTVLSGTDVTDVSTAVYSTLAESTTVELGLPKQEDSNCGFYRVRVDVKKPSDFVEKQ